MTENITQNSEYVMVNGLPLPSRTTRKNIVIFMLLFSWTVIGFVVGWGDPQNSLHQSALSWAYSSMIAVIFAYVFGAVTDNWVVWRNQSTQK